MKNRAIGVGLAALLMIGGTVAANAGTNIPSSETITTVGTVVKEKFVDVGRQGPSVGDTDAWTLDIKSPAGVDLGTERTQCTLGAGRWAICTGAFDITGRGEIVAMGIRLRGRGQAFSRLGRDVHNSEILHARMGCGQPGAVGAHPSRADHAETDGAMTAH